MVGLSIVSAFPEYVWCLVWSTVSLKTQTTHIQASSGTCLYYYPLVKTIS